MITTDKLHNSLVSRVKSPDGTIFVIVTENEEKEPVLVQINIGKAGTAVTAWASALASIITVALESGVKLERILTELSSITSGSAPRVANTPVRSGPEGVYVGLMHYRRAKSEELKQELNGVYNADEDEDEWYGPSIG